MSTIVSNDPIIYMMLIGVHHDCECDDEKALTQQPLV